MFTKEDLYDLVETRARQLYRSPPELGCINGISGLIMGYLFFVEDDDWFAYPSPHRLLLRYCQEYFIDPRDSGRLTDFLQQFGDEIKSSQLTGFHRLKSYVIDQIVNCYLKAIFIANANIYLIMYKINVLRGYIYMADMTKCLDHAQAAALYNALDTIEPTSLCHLEFIEIWPFYSKYVPLFRKILEDNYDID